MITIENSNPLLVTRRPSVVPMRLESFRTYYDSFKKHELSDF